MPAEPFLSGELRFRGISDTLAASHLEGSECCLVHTDNPLHERRVYVNPQVRVGYSGEAYNAVHPQSFLQSPWTIYKAIWTNRLLQWTTSPWLKEWRVQRRVLEWKRRGHGDHEAGEVCLVNEMQVVTDNGWAHV
jgi:hypothetical protein